MYTLSRLARLTANTVYNFMKARLLLHLKGITTCSCSAQDAEGHKIDWTQLHWHDIGSGPLEVSVADVLLLGVVFVSDGAAMPLLAARNKLSANAALTV